MLALLLCLVEQKRTGNIQQGPSNYVSNFGTRTEACVAVLVVQQHRLLLKLSSDCHLECTLCWLCNKTLHFAKSVPLLCANAKVCLGSSSFMLLAPMYDLGVCDLGI
jgi:hypothetical protein